MVTKYDNRTHPIFNGQNNTNSVNLGITTYCSMHCPNCSVAVPREKENKTARHADIEWIIRDSRWMRGLRRIHITGGEPTIHPMFRSIAEFSRHWFKCSYLTIETNGIGYLKYRGTFQFFDLVFITHYLKDAIYPGSPDNSDIIEQAEQDLGDRLIREPPVTHENKHLLQLSEEKLWPGEVTCSKYRNPGLPAGWYNGLLYPCCVTFGIDPSLGIKVTENWKDEIKKVPMGCNSCCYRGT